MKKNQFISKQSILAITITRLVFLFLLVVGVFYAAIKPVYNWDMIGYMGSVLKVKTSDSLSSENFHSETYKILKKELDDDNYNRLISGSYRAVLKTDRNAFEETLPYYAIRVTYIKFINVFFKSGLSLTFSTVLPSLVSVFLMILVFYIVLLKELKNDLLAGLISIIVLYLPQTIYLARLSTPDALSTFLLLLVAVTYFYKYNWFVIFMLMILSVLTRTENVIWCFLLLISEIGFPTNKNKSLLMVLFAMLIIVAYLLINVLHANGGWSILFYNTFIKRQTFPLSLTPALTVRDYVITLIKNTPNYIPWFLLIVTVVYSFKKIPAKYLLMIKGGKIIVVSITSFLVKFVLFPSFDSRFYMGLILVIFIAFVINWSQFKKLYNKSYIYSK